MKAAFCICLFAMMAARALARPNEKYTDKYDGLDLDEILSNDRLRKPYVQCILDQGKCAPDAKELKGVIREALENGCSKCSDKHVAGVKKVVGNMLKNHIEEWKELVAKYDPENKFSKKYEKEIDEVKG